MIKKIESNDSIFTSKDYKKDIVSFSLLEHIRKNPYLLESDGKNCIIGISDPKFPVWIWNYDDIKEKDLDFLCEYLLENYGNNRSSFKFVSKKTLANSLIKLFQNQFNADYIKTSMQSFVNKKVIPAKNTTVIIEQPSINDIEEISICFSEFVKDCYSKETNFKEYLDYAKELIENKKIYIIKQDEKIVAMADCSKEYDDYASIAYVYTKPEYRGNGFASALAAHLSEKIIEKGKLPLLYTDLSNPASNKAYLNVGFEEQGMIDEVELTWKC